MNQKKIHAYSLDVILSNKYLQVIVRCLELKLFNDKDEVLFYKAKKIHLSR